MTVTVRVCVRLRGGASSASSRSCPWSPEEPTILESPAQEDHWTERLQKLAQLRQSGALDASEFAVLKAG